jgi:hypothetical protein
MSWGDLAIDFLKAWPVAIAVWIGAAWLYRKFGEPKSKPMDSEIGPT